MVVSPKQLLSTLESALIGSSTPSTSSQRIKVLLAIRSYLHYFKSLLSTPNSSDRIQVQSISIQFQDYSLINDNDVQIALKLSDDLHLNEVNCVRLLVSANQEVYDMQFELNEIEARREQCPSTISFLNLINALIAEERVLTDRGQSSRMVGLVQLLLKSNASNSLIEDYAACLETRSEESQNVENDNNNNNDPGILILQRARLLKLLAVELPAGDVSSSNQRKSCQTILSNLFGQGTTGIDGVQATYPFSLQDNSGNGDFRTLSKSKAEDILGNPGNSGKGGVYYSEEQASQLHVLTAWLSQIVEVSASRRLAMYEDQSEILFQILDASLSASASTDCSLKMAFIFSQLGCFDVDTTFTSLGATGRIAVGESYKISKGSYSKGYSKGLSPDDVNKETGEEGQGSGLKNEESLKIGRSPKAARLKRRVMLSVTFTYREPNMMYTHKDAIIMRNLLINGFDFREEDIYLLTDLNRNKHLHYATVIDQRLRNLTKGLGVEDTFVLFYSGHGRRRNNRSYIITPDETVVNVENMKRFLKNAAFSVYIICDCCYGGGLRNLRAPNVVLIESARPSEVAYGGTEGSYFTKNLAKILTQDNSKTAATTVNDANTIMMRRGSIQQASLFGTKLKRNSRLFV